MRRAVRGPMMAMSLLLALVASLGPPASAAGPAAGSVTPDLDMSSDADGHALLPGYPLVLRLYIYNDGDITGTARFEERISGSWTSLGSAAVVGRDGWSEAELTIPVPTAGKVHAYRAVYSGDEKYAGGTSDILDQEVGWRTSLFVEAHGGITEGRPAQIHVLVWADSARAPMPTKGTVHLFDITGGGERLAGSAAVEDWGESGGAEIIDRSPGRGDRVYEARYTGGGSFLPSTARLEQVGYPDEEVWVTTRPLSSDLLHPPKDGFVDTVRVRAKRNGEPLTAEVTVESASGAVVRRWRLDPMPASMDIAWDGRNASGALVRAGDYTVVARFDDRYGNSREQRQRLEVITRPIAWRTWSSTRAAVRWTRKGATKYAWVSPARSRFSGGVDLYGNILDEVAWTEYDFSVPRATFYDRIRFSSYGERSLPGSGPGTLTLWDWKEGGDLAARTTGKGLAWWSTRTVSGAEHWVRDRTIRGSVIASGRRLGHFDAAKVRLTLRYGELR